MKNHFSSSIALLVDKCIEVELPALIVLLVLFTEVNHL
jgi:hypothetical protein